MAKASKPLDPAKEATAIAGAAASPSDGATLGTKAPENSDASRGRGRPPGSKTKRAADTSKKPPSEQALGTARGASMLFFGTCIAVGGEGMTPASEEKAAAEFSFAEYLDSEGAVDIPPLMSLTMVLCAYLVPRALRADVQATVKERFNIGGSKHESAR